MSHVPFDDRDGVIWVDGHYVAWREAKLHILTHSLHYGGAVFEGTRAYNGNIFKNSEHNERLLDSAKAVGYDIPYSLEEINKATQDCFDKSGFQNAYIRPVSWRGAEEMGLGANHCKIHLAIAVWEWPNYFPPGIIENGLKLKIASWKRPPAECAPVHAKASGLYMICTLSKHEAEAAGFNDALMLDYRGRVSECSGANIFFVHGKDIKTPEPENFLNGITKQTVTEIAKSRGYNVSEEVIMPEDIAKADEVFVTGTAYEVLPVGQINDTRFNVGPVTKELRQAYLETTGAA